jgi:hypothetical protein
LCELSSVAEAVGQAQHAGADGLGEAGVAFPGGHDDDQAVGVHGVDRLDFGELRAQLLVERCAGVGADEVVDLGPRHAEVKVLEIPVSPPEAAIALRSLDRKW